MPPSRQRLYASLLLLGVSLLFVRNLVSFAGGALGMLMPWAGALLVAESILDLMALAAGVRWWVSRSETHATLPFRLTVGVVALHAVRLLVHVSGRAGPGANFERRPAFRDAVEPSLGWGSGWGWVSLTLVGALLALLAVIVIGRRLGRGDAKTRLPVVEPEGSPFDARVQRFLAQRIIAVVGVSDRRETGCNLAYRRFKAAGYTVWPVNPRLSEFDGRPCFPDLTSIPEVPDAVFILAKPSVTDEIVQECVGLGVRHVWMHCMMGTKPGLARKITSVSAQAVETCEDHGIEVIPGSCPNQFLAPDFAHAVMRRVFGGLGLLRIEQGASRKKRSHRRSAPTSSPVAVDR